MLPAAAAAASFACLKHSARIALTSFFCASAGIATPRSGTSKARPNIDFIFNILTSLFRVSVAAQIQLCAAYPNTFLVLPFQKLTWLGMP
jgi:hypothetical protein